MIDNMEDLLIEILLWLPAKSLIRFKLVCKRWLSIISDHHFSHRHTLRHRHRSNPESSLLLRLEETSNYFYLQCRLQKMVRYCFPPTLIEPTIWSFSNGLFLLVTSSTIDDPLKDFHIYNPTTKQSKKISLDTDDRFRFVVGLNIAFDPSKSPYYHIVCIRSTSSRRPTSYLQNWSPLCQIEAYESGTATWRLCGEPFFAPADLDFNRGVYWKGGIHWRGMYFDLVENSIWKHPEFEELPVYPRIDKYYGDYVESNGSLHYIAHFPSDHSVTVLELESNYSRWSVKYRINLDRSYVPFCVLSIVKGKGEEEEQEQSMLVLHKPGKVKTYEIREKIVKELVDFKAEAYYKDCIQFVSRRTYQFIETLAPV